MTKPKTVKQLLAEANNLARERCECNNPKMDHVVRVEDGLWEVILKGARNYMQISTWDDSLSLRCLIAALREVPVVKQSDTIPFPGRVCTCAVRAYRGEALPKRQSHFDDCAVFGREVPVKKARQKK